MSNVKEVAQCAALAIVHFCEVHSISLYLRFFDGKVSKLYKGEDTIERSHIARVIMLNSFSGNNTDIETALTFARKDIENSSKNEDISKSDVVLLTDGGHNGRGDLGKAVEDIVKTVSNTYYVYVGSGPNTNKEIEQGFTSSSEVDINSKTFVSDIIKAIGGVFV